MRVWARRSDVDRVADHWNDVIHASQICGQSGRMACPIMQCLALENPFVLIPFRMD